MAAPTPTESPRQFAAWLAALFLVVVGAKLWIVQLFGSPLPLWDQWYEADVFFRPWVEGRLTGRDYFAPMNEHRIFFTHVLDMGLIRLNGRWEPLLQMTVNTFLHATFACALAFFLWDFLGRKNGWLVCFLLAPFYALPYAAENTIWAINSQQYFMSLAALVTVFGLGFGQTGSARWWLGLLAAFAGLGTMGSGFLAAVAVGGLMVLRLLNTRHVDRGNLFTLMLCLAIVGLGACLHVTMPADLPLRAHTPVEFFQALARNLAWPFFNHPQVLCWVMVLPLVTLLIFYFRKTFACSRAAEFLLTLGLWSGLQSAAIAFGRANYGDGFPASRYMDVLNLWVIASLFAVILLSHGWNNGRAATQVGPLLPLLLAGGLIFQISQLSQIVVDQLLVPTRLANLVDEERVETFAVTGDAAQLLEPPTVRPDPKFILGLLQNAKLKAILPAACHPPDQQPKPGWLIRGAQILIGHAPWILAAGLALFLALGGFGWARGMFGFPRQDLPGTLILLGLLTVLGFVWSRGGNTRESVEFELQSRLAAHFTAENNPSRALRHAHKAEELKPKP